MSDRIELCIQCDKPTGRAGACEDSIYCDQCGAGPLCEECSGNSKTDRIKTLESALEAARVAHTATSKREAEWKAQAKQAEQERDAAQENFHSMNRERMEIEGERNAAIIRAEKAEQERDAAKRELDRLRESPPTARRSSDG